MLNRDEEIGDVFLKLNSETVQEYIDRVCAEKANFKMTWDEIARVINHQCDLNYSESYYRKHYMNKLREALLVEELLDVNAVSSVVADTDDVVHTNKANELKELLFKIQKEKVKLSDERVQRNADVRTLSREDTIKEIAHDFASQMNEKKFLEINTDRYEIPFSKTNDAILELSDWHYGIEVDNYWNKYNPDIARNRVSKLLAKVLEKCKCNSVETIHVVNLSDLICGWIHLPLRLQSRIDVLTQIMEVSEILAEFLIALYNAGLAVHYYDCLDNHSRLEPNKKNSIDLESLTRITTWYLKERVNHCIKIHDNIYGEDIITFNVKNFRIAGVHGDKDRPQQVVDNLSLMTHEKFDLILTAHMHHFSGDEKNEIAVVSNGSLMGTDEYAKGLRLSSTPSQNLIIVSDDNVIDDICRIIVK